MTERQMQGGREKKLAKEMYSLEIEKKEGLEITGPIN
jgi:hypothetical protein